MVRYLWRASIWHPAAFGPTDSDTDKELKRYALPAFDLFMAVMGLSGLLLGMPSIKEVFDQGISLVASIALLIAGLLAFVGVAFPRLWVAEALGKIIMLFVIGGYAGALWVLNFQGVGQRWIVAIAFTALLTLPTWNLYRLGRERRGRQAIERAAREVIG